MQLCVTAISVVVALGGTSCGLRPASRGLLPQPTRARAFVDAFDRMLIAGFLAGHVSDRGREDGRDAGFAITGPRDRTRA